MKVIIIGGIAAGMSAAAKLRRSDKEARILVFEKEDYISFGACGLPYYIGGAFEEKNNMFARTPEKMKESGIEVETKHQVLSVNTKKKYVTVKNLVTEEVREESYDKLMIATGASATLPPIRNLDLTNIHTLRSMEDGEQVLEKLNDPSIETVAIVGAGFIGLEVVEAVVNKGKKAVVIQLGDRILPGSFDEEITNILEEELKKEGVSLFLNSRVVAFHGDDKVREVELEDKTVQADLVILATGVTPNTAFLKDTDIAMLKNGAIVVDKEGRTNVEDVYAAGDCATLPHLLKSEPAYLPLATGANKLGRIVGENLSGKHVEFEGTLGSSCLKVLGLEAGRTGLSEKEVKELNIPYKTVFIKDKNHTNYYPGQSDIYVKLIYREEDQVILGGQVVGADGAVLRVNVLATAITAKMTTKQLGMLDFCYAPPFSRTWDALGIAGNAAK